MTIREQISALPYPYRAMAERYEHQQGWKHFSDTSWDLCTDPWVENAFRTDETEEGEDFWFRVYFGNTPPIPYSFEWIYDEVNFTIWQWMGWGGTKEALEIDVEEIWHTPGMELGEVGFALSEKWLRRAYNRAGIKDVDLTDVWGKALEFYCMIKEGRV